MSVINSKRAWQPVLALAVALSLPGCANLDRSDQGQILGGVVGGVLGSQIGDGRGQTIATIVGALAGSMIGQEIGERMDERDRLNTATALRDARTGQSTTWVNPDNGKRYTVTPTRTFTANDAPCRDLRIDIDAASDLDQQVSGTACLQSNGDWEIVG
ncbi:MAG: RT0821/Lpp0805 family surface protein [Pseudomonadota bacterium]